MYPAIKLPLSENLKPLSAYLWESNIEHRITEENNQQVLWVQDSSYASWVSHTYQEWVAGRLVLASSSESANTANNFWPCLLVMFKKHIASFSLIAIAAVVSVAILFGHNPYVLQWVSFLPLEWQVKQWVVIDSPPWETQQWWRLITPIFIHFSAMHLVFNVLLVWVFGCAIENKYSGWRLLLLCLLIGIASNLAQYTAAMLTQEASVFGGLSGVNYGLIGYCFMWNKIRDGDRFDLPPALFWVMLGWLVLCISGLVTLLGFGQIANAAHVVGLLTGLFLGWFATRGAIGHRPYIQ